MQDEGQKEGPTPAAAGPGAPAPDSGRPGGGPSAAGSVDPGRIKRDVIETLKTVYDPEIPVNIYELGLIYDVDVAGDGRVGIRMTLTSPACPVAESLPGEVEVKVLTVAGVTAASIELVWEPPWDKDMMSEAARLQLGFF